MRSSLRGFLLFSVFLTGASVLVVEVVATRILSPYFGNTIYTYSSVISVILAALSIGYYVGGKLSDRFPSATWFYGIIYASGVSVLFLELLIILFLPFFGSTFSIVSGPLISSMLLFFFPSILLGMLSPFTIKLIAVGSKKSKIGSIAGTVFFWSTLGSILGSLSAGFFLIPHFGIHQIIIGVGCVLVFLGISGLYFFLEKKMFIVKLVVFSLALLSVIFFFLSFSQADAIYIDDGVYEKILIFDGEIDKKPTRFFKQDRSSSGAMYLDSDKLVYDYTKYYVLHEIFNTNVKRALVLGGGAYSIPKAILKDIPQAQVDVVEIEPSLFDLAKQYFNLEDNPRLTNHIQDGRRFLKETKNNYDLIFSDVYFSLYSIPVHFTTREFFQLAYNKLADSGLFIANVAGDLSRQSPSFLLSEIRTFRSVFTNSYFFAVKSAKQREPQNIIFVGFKSDRKIDFDNASFQQYRDPILQALGEKHIDLNRFEFSEYPIFSDNYAPTDFSLSPLIKRVYENSFEEFSGKETLSIVSQQLRYGPRFLSAQGHGRVQNFLSSELRVFSHSFQVQEWSHVTQNGSQQQLKNIFARFFPEKNDRILLGTHYDSKRFADKDNFNSNLPVPGANDSASGVAVLLEIARVLANSKEFGVGIDIVFFDGEEGEEDLSKTSWRPLGSQYFVEHINDIYPNKQPVSVIILDLVCDKNLTIYKERSSFENAGNLVNDYWNQAREKWPSIFREEVKFNIRDDHTAFQGIGIPSILIGDFNYSHFHTTQDTLDKCSSKSLEIVGNSLMQYLYSL